MQPGTLAASGPGLTLAASGSFSSCLSAGGVDRDFPGRGRSRSSEDAVLHANVSEPARRSNLQAADQQVADRPQARRVAAGSLESNCQICVQAGKRVTVYVGSSDTWGGRNLAVAIVEKCRAWESRGPRSCEASWALASSPSLSKPLDFVYGTSRAEYVLFPPPAGVSEARHQLRTGLGLLLKCAMVPAGTAVVARFFPRDLGGLLIFTDPLKGSMAQQPIGCPGGERQFRDKFGLNPVNDPPRGHAGGWLMRR